MQNLQFLFFHSFPTDSPPFPQGVQLFQIYQVFLAVTVGLGLPLGLWIVSGELKVEITPYCK